MKSESCDPLLPLGALLTVTVSVGADVQKKPRFFGAVLDRACDN